MAFVDDLAGLRVDHHLVRPIIVPIDAPVLVHEPRSGRRELITGLRLDVRLLLPWALALRPLDEIVELGIIRSLDGEDRAVAAALRGTGSRPAARSPRPGLGSRNRRCRSALRRCPRSRSHPPSPAFPLVKPDC